ncbi:MAG: hypothetical protein ACLSGS_06580 [Adlercreutzia sp.]
MLSANLVENDAIAVGDTLTITEGVQDVDQTLVTRVHGDGLCERSVLRNVFEHGRDHAGFGLHPTVYVRARGDFSADLPYTEAYLTVRGAANEQPRRATRYQRLVDEVADRIKALAPERGQARVDQLKSDAQKELDEEACRLRGARGPTRSRNWTMRSASSTMPPRRSPQASRSWPTARRPTTAARAGEPAQRAEQLADAERQIAEGAGAARRAAPAVG